MAALLVPAIRALVPLLIFRWPFWGALLAIAADASDVAIFDALGWGIASGVDYHRFDKIFDTYYLAIEASVAWRRWAEPGARSVALGLFLWRFLGVVAFEMTKIRQVIFFAPNIFENFYLIVAGMKQFAPGTRLDSRRRLALVFTIAAIPKIAQEYIMHFLEFPTWHFIKTVIFRWN